MIRNSLFITAGTGLLLSACVAEPEYSSEDYWVDAPVTAVIPVNYQQQVPLVQRVCEPAAVYDEDEDVRSYCRDVQSYQVRTATYYDITYQYGGEVYHTRMNHNPGAVIRVRAQ